MTHLLQQSFLVREKMGYPDRLLDPDRQVPEIYEGNNEVALDALPAPNYAKGWD